MISDKLTLAGVSALATVLLLNSADAQTTSGSEAGRNTQSNRLMEEVVVTSRRRVEDKQDVPIAIAAYSGEKLEAFGIETAQKLDKITPGLVFGSVIGFNTVFLRGVGSDAYLPSADPSVPIYVDDINSLPSQGSIDALVNVARVEVLKGPQGTLFGRNALGGAIRIVTPDPDDQAFSMMIKYEAGSYSRVDAKTETISAFANIPIMEGLAATLSGIYRDNDPLYENELGGEVSRDSLNGVRAKIRWDVTDTLDITLSGLYDDASTAAGLAGEGTNPSPGLCGSCEADPKFDYKVQHNVPSGIDSERRQISAYVNWDFGYGAAKVIFSDQDLEVPYGSGDLDYTSEKLFNGRVGRQFAEQMTAEIRVESTVDTPLSEKLSWVLGAYYLEASGGYDPLLLDIGRDVALQIALNPNSGAARQLFLAALPSLDPQIFLNDYITFASTGVLDTVSKSVFAEGTYMLIDRLDISLGYRFDKEDRELASSRVDITQDGEGGDLVEFGNFNVPGSSSERHSPRTSIKWSFDESQIYASYSIGYLSPTFNTVNLFNPPNFVEQEEDTAYEIGFKGSWMGGTLQFETALFFIEREDIITAYSALTSGGAVSFFNAGSGEVKGAEIMLQMQPMPNLNPGLAMVVSAAYLDAVYTDFPDGRGFDEESGNAFGPDSLNGLPARNFSGNEIVNSPELTTTLTLVQAISLGNAGELELGFDIYSNSGYYFTAQNTALAEQSAYRTYSARATYFYAPWGLEITAFGENITNEEYFRGVAHLDFGPGRSLADPAYYGVRVKWTFE